MAPPPMVVLSHLVLSTNHIFDIPDRIHNLNVTLSVIQNVNDSDSQGFRVDLCDTVDSVLIVRSHFTALSSNQWYTISGHTNGWTIMRIAFNLYLWNTLPLRLNHFVERERESGWLSQFCVWFIFRKSSSIRLSSYQFNFHVQQILFHWMKVILHVLLRGHFQKGEKISISNGKMWINSIAHEPQSRATRTFRRNDKWDRTKKEWWHFK